MNDEIQGREISDIITGINTEHCNKNCEVHPFMKQGVIKSLRLNEQGLKTQRMILILVTGTLLSVWFKGDGTVTQFFTILHKFFGN